MILSGFCTKAISKGAARGGAEGAQAPPQQSEY